MADQSLRAYVQEVDRLIERNELDEAIAHCRHLLQIYPKHLETYRLLGKAYLEAKRYGDSADILQRVLSAVPDDFIAHIGMSIVREDEGNLDSALWHMERAFETNPANPAIQQELRRLIGRRDGIEPHKVRLTRGALARMYAHGELYAQAIAELRAALEEDPDRPDLDVLLAMLYWRTDQKSEAAEISSRILEKLPYCRDANRIMAAALQERARAEEAATYHRRYAALDPYAAFLESAMADPQTIDPDSLRVEKLSWQPGQPLPATEPGRPEWAASLGIEFEAEAEEAEGAESIPSWLDSESPDSERQARPSERPEPTTIHPFAGAKPPEDTDVPDWMRQAGWTEATGEAVEEPVSFSEEELSSLEAGQVEDTELAPASIPDWLRSIAPEDAPGGPEAEPPSDEMEEDLPDWMAAPPAEPEEEGPDAEVDEFEAPLVAREDEWSDELEEAATASEEVETEAEPGTGEFPAWLEESEPGATETIISWLGDRARTQPTDDLVEEPEEAAEEPSWLSGLAEAAQLADADTDELVEFRKQHETDELTAEPEFEEDEPVKADIPDWLQAISESSPGAPPEDEEASSWLDELGDVEAPSTTDVEQPASEDWLSGLEETEEAPEAAADSLPDWLDEAPAAEVDTGQGEAAESAGMFDSLMPDEGELDWLSELDIEGEAEAAEETEAISAEAPSWLEELGEPEAALEEPELDLESEVEDLAPATEEWTEGDQEPQFEGALDWLREPAQEVSPEPSAEAAEPEPAEPLAAPGMEDMDEDEVFRWLEGLAERQGAREEELLTSPEERVTEPPMSVQTEGPGVEDDLAIPDEPEESLEWLERLAAERGIDADLAPKAADEVPEGEEQPSVPEWLQTMGEQVETPEADLEGQEAGGLPDWLQQYEGADAEAIADIEEPQTEELAPAEGRPEWLSEFEEPTSAEVDLPSEVEHPEPEQAAGEPPDWLMSMAEAPLAPEEEAAWPGGEWIPEEGEAETAETAGDITPAAPEPPETPDEVPAEETTVGAGFEAEPEGEYGWEKPAPADEVEPEEAIEIPDWMQVTAQTEAPLPAMEAAPEGEPEPPPAGPEERTKSYEHYARLVRTAEDLEEVISHLRQAVKEDPDAAGLWQLLGDAYMKADDPPAAIKAYSRGMDELEALQSARQALGSGDYKRAGVHYSVLIKQDSQLDAVIEDLETTLEENPETPELWQTLGDAFMKASRTNDAIKAYRKGMESI